MERPMMQVLSLLLAISTLSISSKYKVSAAAPSYQASCGRSKAWMCSKPLEGLTHHCQSQGLKEEMLVKCVENSIPEVLLRSCIGTAVSTAFGDCVVDRVVKKLPGVVSDCRADTKYSRKSGTLSQCVLERVKGTIYAQDVLSVCSNPTILMAAYDTGCLVGGATQPVQDLSDCSACVCQTLQLESLVSTCHGQPAGHYGSQESSWYQSQPTPSYPSSYETGYSSSPPPSYRTPSPNTYATRMPPNLYRNPSTPTDVYEMPTARPAYSSPMPSTPSYRRSSPTQSYKTSSPPPPPTKTPFPPTYKTSPPPTYKTSPPPTYKTTPTPPPTYKTTPPQTKTPTPPPTKTPPPPPTKTTPQPPPPTKTTPPPPTPTKTTTPSPTYKTTPSPPSYRTSPPPPPSHETTEAPLSCTTGLDCYHPGMTYEEQFVDYVCRRRKCVVWEW